MKEGAGTRRIVTLPLQLAAAWIVIVAVLATAAPLVTSFSPDRVNLDERLLSPGRAHWFGTDHLGRDVFARVIYGSRVSLIVGVTAAAIALIVGVVLGGIAGYFGGAADWLISRLIEVVLCFPFLFLLLAIVATFGPSITTIVVALGLTSWTAEARLARAEFMRLRTVDFAEAARASGASIPRIIARHLLPNAAAPIIVSVTFGVSSAILIESALSFLGFGAPLPVASWGSILASAEEYMGHAWWMMAFPGAAIFLTIAAWNFAGEALRDRLDPHVWSNPRP